MAEEKVWKSEMLILLFYLQNTSLWMLVFVSVCMPVFIWSIWSVFVVLHQTWRGAIRPLCLMLWGELWTRPKSWPFRTQTMTRSPLRRCSGWPHWAAAKVRHKPCFHSETELALCRSYNDTSSVQSRCYLYSPPAGSFLALYSLPILSHSILEHCSIRAWFKTPVAVVTR